MSLQKILVAVFLLTDVVSGRYLTCKIDHYVREEEGEKKNVTHDPSLIEFWPDYLPLKQWVITENHCRYDVKIQFIPFRSVRMADYDAQRMGILPAMKLNYFKSRRIGHLFDRYINASSSSSTDSGLVCSYDTVWYDRPSRFYGHHGYKLNTFDSNLNLTLTTYGLVPFLRQVDAAYRDPYDHRIVYISNDRFYAFSWYEGFERQGRLTFLWGQSFDPYVDSVLVTRDKAICRFSNDRVHCSVNRRQIPPQQPADTTTLYPLLPRNFREVFGTGDDEASPMLPTFPLKGSFWMEERNQTVMLDSNDTFWMYDFENRLNGTKPFCEFEGFSKLSCCVSRRGGDDDDEPAVEADDPEGDGGSGGGGGERVAEKGSSEKTEDRGGEKAEEGSGGGERVAEEGGGEKTEEGSGGEERVVAEDGGGEKTEEGSGVYAEAGNGTAAEITSTTIITTDSADEEKEEEKETVYHYNSASEFSYFWKSLWGFFLFR